MKLVLAISFIVLSCLGIGFYQQSRLAALKNETNLMLGQVSGDAPVRGNPSLPARPHLSESKPLSTELPSDIEPMIFHAFEEIAKVQGGDAGNEREQAGAMEARKRLLTAFAGLDHRVVNALIGRLEQNPQLSTEIKGNLDEVILGILMASNPKEGIKLLQMRAETSNLDPVITSYFSQWATVNPKDALRWFEEESEKGNPVTEAPDLLKAAFLVQARVDPVRALSHGQLEKLSAKPENMANLGNLIAACLEDADENSAFLTALRHEQKRFPASASLAWIREDYISELTGRMEKWTLQEASNLIDSEFTPSEKIVAAGRISHRADLAEPELWADWFAKIKVPKGTLHPLTQFVEGWMHAGDVDSAGKWLEQAPAGELKDELIFEYAFVLAERNPAAAMAWVVKLPEGKLRIRGLRKIGEKWKAKDPTAAAAFAKEHELPQ